jgi:hypothetical protein
MVTGLATEPVPESVPSALTITAPVPVALLEVLLVRKLAAFIVAVPVQVVTPA